MCGGGWGVIGKVVVGAGGRKEGETRPQKKQWGMRASRAQHSTYRECRRRASAGGVNHQSWWPQRHAKPPRQRQAPSVWLQRGAHNQRGGSRARHEEEKA